MTACSAVEHLLLAHALGALDEEEDALLRTHLDDCASCRHARAQADLDLLAIHAPPVDPPERVWTALRAQLDRTHHGDDLPRSDPSPLIHLACSFCRGPLLRSQAAYCASCLAPHHGECFREHGRCAVMGCAETRTVQPADPDATSRPTLVAPPRKPRSPNPWRLRLLAVVAASSIGGAAAWTAHNDAPPLDPPSPSASAHELPRWNVAAQDATLGELAEAVGQTTGARLDVHPALASALLRGVQLDDVTVPELADQLARSLGPVRTHGDGERWTLSPRGDTSSVPRAEDVLLVRETRHLECPEGRVTERTLTIDARHRALPAPQGPLRVVLRGARLLSFHDVSFVDALSLDAAPLDVAWTSPRDLAVLDLGSGHLRWLRLSTAGAFQWVGSTPLPAAALGPDARLRASGADPSVVYVVSPPTHVTRVEGARAETLSLPFPIAQTWIPSPERLLVQHQGADGVAAYAVEEGRLRPRWRRPHAQLEGVSPTRLVVSDRRHGAASFPRLAARTLLLDPETGLDTPISLPNHRRLFTLHPDAHRAAWIDPEQPHRVHILDLDRSSSFALDLNHGPCRGLRWDPASATLLAWSDHAVSRCRLEPSPASDLVFGPVDQFSIRDLQPVDPGWLITFERGIPRNPEVQVRPAHQTAQVRGYPGVVLDDPVRPEFRFELPLVDPLTHEVELSPQPAPSEPTPPPPVEPEDPTPTPLDAPSEWVEAPPELDRGLVHVEPGQRYVFRTPTYDEVWEVQAIAADRVVYRQSILVRGQPVARPELKTWRRADTTPLSPLAQPVSDHRIPGLDLEVYAQDIGQTQAYLVVIDGSVAFPGVVQDQRGGVAVRALIRVEEPTR